MNVANFQNPLPETNKTNPPNNHHNNNNNPTSSRSFIRGSSTSASSYVTGQDRYQPKQSPGGSGTIGGVGGGIGGGGDAIIHERDRNNPFIKPGSSSSLDIHLDRRRSSGYPDYHHLSPTTPWNNNNNNSNNNNNNISSSTTTSLVVDNNKLYRDPPPHPPLPLTPADRGISNITSSGSTTKRQRTEEIIEDFSPAGTEEKVGREDIDNRPISSTCTSCRARKTKCNGAQPVCKNCSKSGNVCEYRVKQKPGLKAGTGESMMRRLEYLEDRLSTNDERLSTQDNLVQSLSFSDRQHSIHIDHLERWRDEMNVRFNQIQALSGMNNSMGGGGIQTSSHFEGSSSFNPGTGGTDRAIGSGTYGLGRGNGGGNAGGGGPSPQDFLSPLGGGFTSQASILPPDDIVRDLIELYGRRIAPWTFIVSPQVLITSTTPWSLIIYAIVAITLRLSRDERLRGLKERYHDAARQYVIMQAMDDTSVESLQALALLTIDGIGAGQGPKKWGVLATLTRSVAHIDLCTETDTLGGNSLSNRPIARTSIIPPISSWHDDEERRRLFWLIFILDRYTSISTGWEFAINDHDVKRRLPSSDEAWISSEWHIAETFVTPLFRDNLPLRNTESLHPMIHFIDAMDMIGRVHMLGATPVDLNNPREVDQRSALSRGMQATLKRWFFDLPPQIRSVNGDLTSAIVLTHSCYQASILKLLAFQAYPLTGATTGLVEPHATSCLEAARAICHLAIKVAESPALDLTSPFLVWSCWVAGRVLFVHACLALKTHQEPEFEPLIQCLHAMKADWSIAGEYAHLLERAQRKLQAFTTASESLTPDSHLSEAVSVLLDMRHTAYSAVRASGTDTPPEQLNTGGMNNNSFMAGMGYTSGATTPWAMNAVFGFGDLESWLDFGTTQQTQMQGQVQGPNFGDGTGM